jgi:hypothetical protein
LDFRAHSSLFLHNQQQHKDLLRDALIHITIVIYPPLMLLALLLGLES